MSQWEKLLERLNNLSSDLRFEMLFRRRNNDGIGRLLKAQL